MPTKRPPWTASLPKFAVLAVILGGAALIAFRAVGPQGGAERPGEPPAAGLTVQVALPASLSGLAADGRILFQRNCAACHGENAAGTGRGPPLVHDLYNPGHHSDDAFVAAAQMGVRSHHWPYGNMPPQTQVSEAQVRAIARYVRELQAANGIATRPHNM